MNDEIPILYYDAQCPVCKSFIKLIRKSIPDHQLKFYAISEIALSKYHEFYIEIHGEVLIGKDAVDYISKNFPQIKEYFWMLPPNYRHDALQGSLKIAQWIRRYIFRRRDCNCNETTH